MDVHPAAHRGSFRASAHRRGLRYPCDHCHAAPGQPCRTASGRPAATQHVNRTYKAWQSWHLQLPDSRKAHR